MTDSATGSSSDLGDEASESAPDEGAAASATPFTIQAASLPKAGQTAADNEDAWAVAPEEGPLRAGTPLCAAIADGATESAFARLWAERLVQRAVEHPLPGPSDLPADAPEGGGAPPAWDAAIAAAQDDWQAAVRDRQDQLAWYAAAKAEEGAHAALLSLTARADRTWTAVAVGDCTLFHLQSGSEKLRWPYDAPEAFGNRPALLPSDPDRPVPSAAVQTGTWGPEDAFVLATDAAAAWLMRRGPAAASALVASDTAEAVATARSEGALRNDDTTIIVVTFGPRSTDDGA
jgi:hypothetical protein